ncbi:MAG: hypothetical protein OER80_12265 [Gammaproteobacteria bacterium]|nr:hypothetical protein [Gammaproteobacteria bacterium]MDH3768440.1 hypothetical protein [Gammaproteobacteria bacterium]
MTESLKSLLLILVACGLVIASGCDRRIYTKDGVTDGDAFFVPPDALTDNSPDTRSWVAYSLGRSTCQLAVGGDNPARNNSFDCELKARKILVRSWLEQSRAESEDAYLDALTEVSNAGFLGEYVWFYLRRADWTAPDDLQMERFEAWRREQLRGHKVTTRLIGSWNYASP